MTATYLEASESDATDLGFKPFKLTRLKKIVAVAGANGAGKTRLLQYVRSVIQHRNNNPLDESWLAQANSEIDHLRGLLKAEHAPWVPQRLADLTLQLDLALRTNRVDTAPSTVTHLIRPRPGLSDTAHLARNQLRNFEQQAESVGNDNDSKNYTVAHIEKVQTRWFNTSHPSSGATPSVAQHYLDSFNYLQELTKRLLGQPLDFAPETRQPLLFGKPVASGHLSDGQQLLLELVVDIHAKKPQLAGAVIFFDEPELHLHPGAIIEVVDQIANLGEQTQLWIATHCVPLLAHLQARNDSTIIYIKDGYPAFAGSTPQSVLKSLLGDEQRLAELQEYIGLPDNIALSRFAAECLVSPEAVSASSSSDPQVNLIRRALRARPGVQTVLDFGAGQGRLLETICAGPEQSERNLINYFAFETNETAASKCKSLCAALIDPTDRVFQSDAEVHKYLQSSSIDLIVLCNVLHEIEPSQWIDIFTNTAGIIQRVLKDDGFLLVVEDHAMPHGESAHNYGFLVLDADHLRTLFAVQQEQVSNKQFLEYATDGCRHNAVLIQKPLLKQATGQTQRIAIEQLKERARQKIKGLRGKTRRSFQDGRLHAYWLSQFANSSFWLADNPKS